MKKLIPLFIVLSLVLTACGVFPFKGEDDTVSDSEMATRVAQLLATMTTPTVEIAFPDTSTPAPATLTPVIPTATADLMTQEPTPLLATEEPQETAEPTAGSGTPQATQEPTTAATSEMPSTDPVRKLGTPGSSDPFDSYEKWSWPTDSDDYLAVAFKDGYMQLTGLTTMAGWRLPLISQQTNSYYELTVNSATCADKDSYGIIFRVPVFKEPTQGYLYEVTCDGYLRLWKWDGKVLPNGKAEILINWKQSTDVNTGANKVNRLGVMAVGSQFTIYMNGVAQGTVSDSSFKAGFFGVFVRSVTTPKYTVKFDEMKFWENPAQ
jgi:hypothetical protein